MKGCEIMTTSSQDKLAIVILNYSSWQESLREAKICNEYLSIPYEDIIIIDNNSPNDSAIKLKTASKDKGYIFLKAKHNDGYASGNNIGLRYAKTHGYKYCWILNNDINFEDKAIVKKLINVFKKDESIAIVNPKILSPDGYLFNYDAVRYSFFDLTIGMLNYRKKGRNIVDLGGYGYVYRPQGCCMIVDLDKMAEIDYFDENTFLYCEEPILAERLLKKGYKCACCLTTEIIHNHSKTVKSVFQKREINKIQNESFKYYLYEYRKYNEVMTTICLLFNKIKSLLLQ